MARNSKTKKNARYRKRQKRNRLDMRSGGRVALQAGGSGPKINIDQEELKQISKRVKPDVSATQSTTTTTPTAPAAMPTAGPETIEKTVQANTPRGNIRDDQETYAGDPSINLGGTQQSGTSVASTDYNRVTANLAAMAAANANNQEENPLPEPDYSEGIAGGPGMVNPEERRERIARTGETIEAGARGELPESALIDPEDVARVRDEQMREGLGVIEEGDLERVPDRTTDPVTGEVVSTKQASISGAPREVSGQQYTADKVQDIPVFDPATGLVTDEMRATLDEKALTFQASGVDFSQEQKDRGITDRIVGTLDSDAKVNALVKVAGTDLPRVLRAKKQLRRAGLSEADIDTFANNPDQLEDKLMEFTEAERGMVAGLPDEALVNVQLNSLLDGMESGEIPAFARPAVSAVNQMLAERGLDASTVGRDALFNAIISAAVPIAQSNAQSIKESIVQQRGIEAQAAQTNAQIAQQTALSNAEKEFGLNMAQFTADQNRVLSDSKFLQSTSLTEVSTEAQAIVQNAANWTQMDVSNLTTQERLQMQNAQAFLSMEMTNLDKTQQQRVLNSQQDQQRMLTNQAAENAARQFGATSQQQADQFMSNLAAQIDQNNTQQLNAMKQFNATQENAAEARRAARDADLAKFDAQLLTQIDQYNSQQEFNRNKFNQTNALAIEQANVQLRRQQNLADTAALNAATQQNAQQAYGLTAQSQSFLWQELRDQADYDFKVIDNEEQRKTALFAAALSNEGAAYKGRNWSGNLSAATSVIDNFVFGGSGNATNWWGGPTGV